MLQSWNHTKIQEVNSSLPQSVIHYALSDKDTCIITTKLTRMWANAQPDGRPAKHRWRPLFNAAKFGWRPLLDAVQ